MAGTVGVIAGDFIRWGGLVLFTTFIFGFFINDSRRFLRERRFWRIGLTERLALIARTIFVVEGGDNP